ncbi:MAG: aspartate ammonia-lyase [Alphaproteobacteria bacterium]|nr:aspartate ammonia-lyase [Alphaproteobacteria bacterium]
MGMSGETRKLSDSIGEIEIPKEALWSVQTQRAVENFPISGYKISPVFIKSFAEVKKACAITNNELGYLDKKRADAIIKACDEIIAGKHHDHVPVDAFQGGAGTSTNMNMNETIANRATQILGGDIIGSKDADDRVLPIRDVNMHQSTNDAYPTALKVAILKELNTLEGEVAKLQESMQTKETEFADVLKSGRTQMQDAVPMTLGMEFGAYAEAIARDRWRVFKSRERIKQVNLGGTAIGTGLGAPRKYIFRVSEVLREVTGLNISRAENLIDGTQNCDSYVEVSGMLKAYASNIIKIANDLRFMSSGPHAGIREITLPPMQTGSSIMPGKVNPVIPEMAVQVALRVMANDQTITLVASMGQLELNQIFPMLAFSMLESLKILINGTKIFRDRCVDGIEAVREKCDQYIKQNKTIATVLVPVLGYKNVETAIKESEKTSKPIGDVLVEMGLVKADKVDDLLSAKWMCKLGYEDGDYDQFIDRTQINEDKDNNNKSDPNDGNQRDKTLVTR